LSKIDFTQGRPGAITARQLLAESIAAFEERAAIIEYDGGLNREDAEENAAQILGGRPVWTGTILKVIAVCEPAPAPTTAPEPMAQAS